MVKYIFVTGGVLSSVGKGILTSSIGKMLQTRGLKVTVVKIDPYVNVDDAATPAHSFYGSPGSWTLETVGEFCFFAFVRHLATGIEAGRWTGPSELPAWPSIVRSVLTVPGREPAVLRDLNGRKVMDLQPGSNDVGQMAPGIYFAETKLRPRPARVVIQRH
jgi:hypothetical protein